MIFRTSRGVNRIGWGVCERALKLDLSRKDLTGKAKAKTGIGKSDFPGLQGARGNVTWFMTKCARLGSIPTRSRQFFRPERLKSPVKTSQGSITSALSTTRPEWGLCRPLSLKRQPHTPKLGQ
jgi:hypothetical protein